MSIPYWADRDCRRLIVGDDTVELTRMMAEIVDFLLENHGTSEQIADHIHRDNPEPLGGAETIKVYIHRLRKLGVDVQSTQTNPHVYWIGAPPVEWRVGEQYVEGDEVFICQKVITEAVVVLADRNGLLHHMPVSSVRLKRMKRLGGESGA